MVVAAASMLGAFGSPYMKWATYTSARSLTGGFTGLAAAAAGGVSSTHIASTVIATTAGAVVLSAALVNVMPARTINISAKAAERVQAMGL